MIRDKKRLPIFSHIQTRGLLCLLLGLVFFLANLQGKAQAPEPVYNGKPESYWINFLKDESTIWWLEQLGTNQKPVLLKAIEIKQGTNAEAIRKNGSMLLERYKGIEALMESATNNSDPEARHDAVANLIFNANKMIVPALTKALEDKTPGVRRAAAFALSLSAREKGVSDGLALAKCLIDEDSEVRMNAARTLASYPREKIVSDAFMGILRQAQTNSNADVRDAAGKALQNSEPPAVLEAYLSALVFIHDSREGHLWKATVKAVDEADKALPMADVEISGIKGLTDTNGVFAASHRDMVRDLVIHVEKAGYYSTGFSHEFLADALFSPDQSKPEVISNSNPVITLILKKIIHPVPMYVSSADIAHTKKPALNTPLGFDLRICDWVAPNGKGTNADILFTQKMEKSEQDFDGSLIISFPNPGDGIQEFRSVEDRFHGPFSKLKSPQIAPENGYQSSVIRENSRHPGKPPVFDFDQLHRNYIFRVQTHLDDSGKVKSALYGKIYGDFEERIWIFLNPEPNSRSLEYDPKLKLGKGPYSEWMSY